MPIFYLSNQQRIDGGIEPLARLGFLPDKRHAIDRNYDHLAFSYRTGRQVRMLVRQHGVGEILVDYPHCALVMPGESWVTTPLDKLDELFFVFSGDSAPRLFDGASPKRPNYGILPLDQYPLVGEYVELMLKLMQLKLTSYISTQLDCLAHAILAATYWRDILDEPVADSRLAIIEGHVVTHYNRDIDFKNLAAHFGMSYAKFRRLWAQNHEQSPLATVLELRNLHACELLQNSELSITEVAAFVGYDDVRYFSRFFRARNGLTPSEFRRRSRHAGPATAGYGEGRQLF